ncbi:MAG: homoserine dehydrogenase [Bacteroidales bacterium]|nr:homoserine dehydrogenase [Bacteroidales bacterium]
MDNLNVAILGCGTVGGGVARILLDMQDELTTRAGKHIRLVKIVELSPEISAKRFNIPLDLFCGKGSELSKEESNNYIREIIQSDEIDLIVETIGGSNDFVEQLAIDICKSGKHLITANKALLAERGDKIFGAAKESGSFIGYEAAVCGAIPVIKTIKESFTGDRIRTISGIMNGTSNYILSMMHNERMEFKDALKLAQENGYAESDPTLDINGYDAGHKLVILIRLAFGVNLPMYKIPIQGIENIQKEDIEFAEEIGAKIKLICFAHKIDGKIYATVCPMMVKNSNFLAEVNGATNAVKFINEYSGKHILVGAGAGSSETASSIVADIVFGAKHQGKLESEINSNEIEFTDAKHYQLPYIITFETGDIPGITGLVTTSIGHQNINIDTVSHNRHKRNCATFFIATMPCTLQQVEDAIQEIRKSNPEILLSIPKIIPILN